MRSLPWMGHPRNRPTLCWSLRAGSLPPPPPQRTPFPGGLAGGAPRRAAQGPTDKSLQTRWRGAAEWRRGRAGPSRARRLVLSSVPCARSVSGRPRGSRFARGAGRGRRPQVAPRGGRLVRGPPAQEAEGRSGARCAREAKARMRFRVLRLDRRRGTGP